MATQVSEDEDIRPLHLFFSMRGRISRRKFWLGNVVLALLGSLLLSMVEGQPPGELATRAMAGATYALLMWTGIAVQVKRWHDRGKPGWLVVVNVIPVIGFLIWLVELGLRPGDPGVNRYGEPPSI